MTHRGPFQPRTFWVILILYDYLFGQYTRNTRPLVAYCNLKINPKPCQPNRLIHQFVAFYSQTQEQTQSSESSCRLDI